MNAIPARAPYACLSVVAESLRAEKGFAGAGATIDHFNPRQSFHERGGRSLALRRAVMHGGACSHALRRGLPKAEVLKQGRWEGALNFDKHYNKYDGRPRAKDNAKLTFTQAIRL